MKFTIEANDCDGVIRFAGEFTQRELADIHRQLSTADKVLLRTDEASSSADYLLALEVLFRRSEENDRLPQALVEVHQPRR